jgi:hypothetical protein
MSTRARAIIIGMLGPLVQGAGLLWVLANALLDSGRGFSLSYVSFDPAHLVVFVGMLLSVVCLPIALEVAAAAPEDVELELFEPEPGSQPSPALTDEVGGAWEGATD